MPKFIGGLLLSPSDEHFEELLGSFQAFLNIENRPIQLLTGSIRSGEYQANELKSASMQIVPNPSYFTISNCQQTDPNNQIVFTHIPTKSSSVCNFTDGIIDNLTTDSPNDDLNTMLAKLNLRTRKKGVKPLNFADAIRDVLLEGVTGDWSTILNFLGTYPSFILGASGNRRVNIYYLRYFSMDIILFSNFDISLQSGIPFSINRDGKIAYYFLHPIVTLKDNLCVLRSKYLLTKFKAWKRKCAEQGVPNRSLVALGALDQNIYRLVTPLRTTTKYEGEN